VDLAAKPPARSHSWKGLRSADPKVRKRVREGPASHNGINSSCFTLLTMAQFQGSRYDQAYFSGYCGKGGEIVIGVKGVRGVSSATIPAHERDNEKTEVSLGGRLTLAKKLPDSAAFLVKFDL
jgi:hypothetical protein